jgi:hypothetical protein
MLLVLSHLNILYLSIFLQRNTDERNRLIFIYFVGSILNWRDFNQLINEHFLLTKPTLHRHSGRAETPGRTPF